MTSVHQNSEARGERRHELLVQTGEEILLKRRLPETLHMPVSMKKVIKITRHSGDISREPEACGPYRKES